MTDGSDQSNAGNAHSAGGPGSQPGHQPEFGQQQQGQPPQYNQPHFGQPQYGQQPDFGQPQYGQAPQSGQAPQYGQPQYGQPQYGQPQYGAPGYGQQPYGAPGMAPVGSAYGSAPARKSRKKMWALIGAGVAAVLIIGAVANVATHTVKDEGKYTLSEPAAVSGYAKVDTAAAESAQSQLSSSLSGKLLKKGKSAKFGLYAQSGSQDPAFLFIGFDKENSDYPGHSPKTTLKDFFVGAQVADQRDKPTGSFGGVLQCGTSATGQRVVCGWADGSSLASLIFTSAPSLDQAAATTLALRTASEH